MSDMDEKPKVLSVEEGFGTHRAGRIERTFSVVLNRPIDGDDLSVVAEAAMPAGGRAIPAAGSPHPDDAGLIARPPIIYPVGIRMKGGGMLAASSNFYNVRVPYVPGCAGKPEIGNGEGG